MDQHERIRRLQEEAVRLAGGEMYSRGIENLPPDVAEQFLKRVIAIETAPTTTNFEQLRAAGVELPEPSQVSDANIAAVLWEVIRALAKLRVFLNYTDHLSDRELYTVLWNDVLREDVVILPDGDDGAWIVDVPGDDEYSTNYLTYYATDEDRKHWQEGIPDLVMPRRQQPRYDRDATLPEP